MPDSSDCRPGEGGAVSDRLLTITEVCDRVQLRPDAVYRAIRRGDLQASKLGGRLRIRPQALEAWIDKQSATRPPAHPRPTHPRAVRRMGLDKFKLKVT
jgi:excisionase family DNA binding protein